MRYYCFCCKSLWMIKTLVDGLLTGKPKEFASDGRTSAIAREPQAGAVMLGYEGFEGDEVADKIAHGGADKAVHLYPPEHYPYWNVKLDGHPLLGSAGAFGENISAVGLTEDKVKIGDRFRMGNAVVEISHGRQPCWKIDHRFGAHGLSRDIIRNGKCGLYFRVIETGEVAAGDVMTQVEDAPHDWTVRRVFKLLIGGGHRGEGAADALASLAELNSLAQAWRERAAKLAGN